MFKKIQWSILVIVIILVIFIFLEPILLYTPLSCRFYNLTYIFLSVCLISSLLVSLRNHRGNSDKPPLHWIVPLFCLLALLVIYFSYRFGMLSIYEDIFRAVGKGPYESCEQFPIKFLIKNY